MSEKEKVIAKSVQKKGVFDFEGLYKLCTKWLEDNGYFIQEGRNNEDKNGRIEKMIKWKNEKKITDYFKLIIKLKFTTDMKEVKSKENKEINKGEVKLKFKGLLESDWSKEWEGRPFLKFFRDFYDKYLIKGRVDKYRQTVKEDVEEMANQCRGFLGLKRR